MHSTLMRVSVDMATNSAGYDWGQKGGTSRPYVFANLGVDFPIWSGSFQNEKYGISITLPYMIDVWLDIFERTTAPVINTSYRFGFPELSFIHRTPQYRYIKNYTIRLSPMKHECTHIGDELAILRQDEGLPINRINVSYNYTELALTINDPDGSRKQNHTLRTGGLVTHDFNKGWYDSVEAEAA